MNQSLKRENEAIQLATLPVTQLVTALVALVAQLTATTQPKSLMTLLKLVGAFSLCSFSFALSADPMKTRTIQSGASNKGHYIQPVQHRSRQHQSNGNKRSHLRNHRQVKHVYHGSQNRDHRNYKGGNKSDHKNSRDYRYNSRHSYRYVNRYNNRHNNRNQHYRDPDTGLVVIPLAVSAPNTGKIFPLHPRD